MNVYEVRIASGSHGGFDRDLLVVAENYKDAEFAIWLRKEFFSWRHGQRIVHIKERKEAVLMPVAVVGLI